MKWLPSVFTVLLTLIGVADKPIQDTIAAHPAIAIVMAGVYAVLKALLPSPIAK